MSSIRSHLFQVVCYYENALSLQDRMVERERAKGHPSQQDEDLLESMRRSLEAALEALRRVDNR